MIVRERIVSRSRRLAGRGIVRLCRLSLIPDHMLYPDLPIINLSPCSVSLEAEPRLIAPSETLGASYKVQTTFGGNGGKMTGKDASSFKKQLAEN